MDTQMNVDQQHAPAGTTPRPWWRRTWPVVLVSSGVGIVVVAGLLTLFTTVKPAGGDHAVRIESCTNLVEQPDTAWVGYTITNTGDRAASYVVRFELRDLNGRSRRVADRIVDLPAGSTSHESASTPLFGDLDQCRLVSVEKR